MLNAHVPLVEIRLLQIERKDGIDTAQWKRAVLIQSNRVGIPAGNARPWIIERGTVDDDACSFGRCVPLSAILVQVGEIEKDSVSRPNNGHAITFRIKRKSHARREAFPVVRLPRIGIWNSAFSLEVNARRRVGIDAAHDPLIEARLVEERALTGPIVGRPERLPSHTTIHREVGGCFPRILEVQTNVILPEVLVRDPALSVAVRPSGHQVGKPRPRVDTRKRKRTGSSRTRRVIHHLVRQIHAESDLVCASGVGEIFTKLVNGGVGDARSRL